MENESVIRAKTIIIIEQVSVYGMNRYYMYARMRFMWVGVWADVSSAKSYLLYLI